MNCPSASPVPSTSLARVARGAASALALALGVIGSVATSPADGPVVRKDLTLEPLALSAEPTEQRVHVRFTTARAFAHELTLALVPADEAQAPVAARIEIEGADDEILVIDGAADAWVSGTVEVPTECDDGGCAFDGDVTLRLQRTDGDAASLPVRLHVSAVAWYDEDAAPGADEVELTLAQPAALDDADGGANDDGADEGAQP